MAALGGARLEHLHPHRGDPLPRPEAVDGIVVFGGAESVTEIDRHPYLVAEAELLREAAARDLPVLGICLAPRCSHTRWAAACAGCRGGR